MSTPSPDSGPETARRDRNRRIAVTGGILAVLAIVIATGVWATAGGSSTPTTASATPEARVGDHSLLIGDDPAAPLKVVVYEDFLCPFCRQLETSTRDFLHQDAAKGRVLVEYRPFQLLPDPYSARALNAWGVVLQKGTPAQALRFHDLLYDKQPYEQATNKPDVAALQALAKRAGVTDSAVLDAFATPDKAVYAAVQGAAVKARITGTPTVFVNGKRLQGSSVQDIADQLEKLAAGS